MRLCREQGIKVGLRFTMTERNVESLPEMLDLVGCEEIDKFYLSHLVYAGRGNRYRDDDAYHRTTRGHGSDLRALLGLRARGGVRPRSSSPATTMPTGSTSSSGCAIAFPRRRTTSAPSWRPGAAMPPASTSPTSTIWATSTRIPSGGTTIWATCAKRPFSEIWPDTSDPIMAGLKARPRGGSSGRCGAMPLLRRLRRQHTGALVPAVRRSLGRGPGLLPERCGDRRAARPPPRGDTVQEADSCCWRPLDILLASALVLALGADAGSARPRAAHQALVLYQEHCAACHGAERLGQHRPGPATGAT